jgi:hypothetical protein
MTKDAWTSLIVKILLMVLTPLAAQLHINDGATLSAIATDFADVLVLAYGLYQQWNMKRVHKDSVSVAPMSGNPNVGGTVTGKVVGLLLVAFAASLFLADGSQAADLSTKATPALSYNYPTTKCGLYYGINTMGSTGSVDGAAVGTQVVQGDIGLTLGYTCPAGLGYWFLDASADFANLNGSQNGLSLSGPAQFMERFGFGAPVNQIIALVPGLASLQNAVPSLIPLPAGVAVVTSNPYLFGAVHETDVSLANGLGSNREWLVSTGIGIGNKTRLSNGVVFDPFVEYVLPGSKLCIGPTAQCYTPGNQVNVGMILEF